MTLDLARQDIVTAVQAAKAAWSDATLKVQFDNRNLVDISVQVDPYICVEIVWMGGYQLDMAKNPFERQDGNIVLTAMQKENSGSAEAMLLLQHFKGYLSRKNFSLVRTLVGGAQKSVLAKGWEGFPLVIPFWFIEVAP